MIRRNGRFWVSVLLVWVVILVGCRPVGESPLLERSVTVGVQPPVVTSDAVSPSGAATKPAPTVSVDLVPYPMLPETLPGEQLSYPVPSLTGSLTPMPYPQPESTTVPAKPSAVPLSGPPALGVVVLLHTNDTWGYYAPCG
jgi:hypothetical protein